MTEVTAELLAQIRKDAEAAKGNHPWWNRGQHVHDMPMKEPHGWPSAGALLCCMKNEDEVLARNPVAAASHIANVDPATTIALLDHVEALRECNESLQAANDYHRTLASCAEETIRRLEAKTEKLKRAR